MSHRRMLVALTLASFTCLAPTSAALANPLLGIVPVPGLLGEQQRIQGPLNLSIGMQSLANYPNIMSLDFVGDFGKSELGTRMIVAPQDFTSFFGADLYGQVVGETGSFLPLNLMPIMGIGAGMYLFQKPGSTSGTDIDAAMPIFVPMGLRYVLPIGDLSIGATALYFHQLMDYASNRSNFDVSRWRYEATLRWGFLNASLYSENGAILSGNGFRFGFNFMGDD